jgi:hypothetical protein
VRKLTFLLVLVLIASGFVPHMWGERRLLLREIRKVSDLIQTEPEFLLGKPGHEIHQVRFSPDERWLAVWAGTHRRGEGAYTHLLILPLEGNPETAREYLLHFPAGFWKSSNVEGSPLEWSPTSGHLALSGIPAQVLMVEVEGGRAARLEGRLLLWGFLSESTLLTSLVSSPFSFRTYGVDGALIQEIPVMGRQESVDARGPGNTVAVAFVHEKPVLLDPVKGRAVKQFDALGFGLRVGFGNGGKSLCVTFDPITLRSAALLGSSWDRDTLMNNAVDCWNLETGEKTRNLAVLGGRPSAVGRESTRMVLTESKATYNVFTQDQKVTYRRQLLWDFAQDRELCSWKPTLAPFRDERSDKRKKKEWMVPALIDLSASGRYFVEAFGETVRIYEFQP